MIPYTPLTLITPPMMIAVPTAWDEMELALTDIIARFQIPQIHALEFGVDYGYSTAALANYFQYVTGVDTFLGDAHAGFRENLLAQTSVALKDFLNVELKQADYRDWIETDPTRYDLIHVDIVHTYEDTYRCGAWAVEHSDICLFHDTLSFPDVYRACEDIASNYELNFYNWEHRHGLGILSKRRAL